MNPRKKILLIDDENLILVTTRLLLREMNADIITANSGTEGLTLAQRESPDIILLDIMMPEMDGWSVLSRLKADARLSLIPVVVMSGDDPIESGRMGKERGASAVCGKPFDANDLIAIIEGLIGERPQ
jgi:CheY-like chemotaxis protein